MNSSAELERLFNGYIDNSLTPEELERLSFLIRDKKNNDQVSHLVEKTFSLKTSPGAAEYDIQLLFGEIMSRSREEGKPPVRIVPLVKTAWFRWAAVFVLFIGAGIYYFLNDSRSTTNLVTDPPVIANDVMPGTDKAILTLSNGKQVVLSDTAEGIIADGLVSIENKNGQLLYSPALAAGSNTMTTPKGGQYQLKLADGTKVWLNAASSITYPIKFQEKERAVTISGEVYFEVTRNARSPFVVSLADSTRIEVLGTAFNVYAYDDVPSPKISLANGSIKIRNKLLRPGEAFINGQVVPTNIAKDIAWKSGVFDFQDAGIDEVMRQFSRWYNIEVVYERGIPDIQFFGKMGRDLSLASALKLLKKTKVNFRLEENNRLVILP